MQIGGEFWRRKKKRVYFQSFSNEIIRNTFSSDFLLSSCLKWNSEHNLIVFNWRRGVPIHSNYQSCLELRTLKRFGCLGFGQQDFSAIELENFNPKIEWNLFSVFFFIFKFCLQRTTFINILYHNLFGNLNEKNLFHRSNNKFWTKRNVRHLNKCDYGYFSEIHWTLWPFKRKKKKTKCCRIL